MLGLWIPEIDAVVGCLVFVVFLLSGISPLSMDWFKALRENLNRKPWLLPSNIGVSCKISHHPIL
jgi:hypothetical protein